MSIEWSAPARADLKRIIAYIQRDDDQTAQRVAQRIVTAVESLGGFPGRGRPGRVAKTRELVIPGLPYVLPYVPLEGGGVVILRVLHTSMRWPER